MAIYHLTCKIGSRANGQNAVASASYRSAEKLHDERENKTFDYSRKQAVIYSNILLPDNAPKNYLKRENLWNAVEASEKQANAQIYREFEVSLPNECTIDEKIALADAFAEQLKNIGMCVDYNIHDVKKNQYKTKHRKASNDNSHCHFMCTMRKIDKNGKFLPKRKRGYKLDQNGNKIPVLDKNGNQKTEKKTGRKLWEREDVRNDIIIDKDAIKNIRQVWQNIANKTLQKYNTSIDCRTLAEQVADKIAELEAVEKALNEAKKEAETVKEAEQPTCTYYEYYNAYLKALKLDTKLYNLEKSTAYREYHESQVTAKISYKTTIDLYNAQEELKKLQDWYNKTPEPALWQVWKIHDYVANVDKYEQAQKNVADLQKEYDKQYKEAEQQLIKSLQQAYKAEESAKIMTELTKLNTVIKQNKQFYHDRMQNDYKNGIKPIKEKDAATKLGAGKYHEEKDIKYDAMDSNTEREMKWLRAHGYER